MPTITAMNKIKLVQCYHCYAIADHKKPNCPYLSQPQKCPRCAQVGHRSWECENRSFCLHCRGPHPVTAPCCPIYQEEMEKMKPDLLIELTNTHRFKDLPYQTYSDAMNLLMTSALMANGSLSTFISTLYTASQALAQTSTPLSSHLPNPLSLAYNNNQEFSYGLPRNDSLESATSSEKQHPILNLLTPQSESSTLDVFSPPNSKFFPNSQTVQETQKSSLPKLEEIRSIPNSDLQASVWIQDSPHLTNPRKLETSKEPTEKKEIDVEFSNQVKDAPLPNPREPESSKEPTKKVKFSNLVKDKDKDPKPISWSEFVPPIDEIIEIDHDYCFDSCGSLIKAKCYNGIHNKLLKFLHTLRFPKNPEDNHLYFSFLQNHAHLHLAGLHPHTVKLALNEIKEISLNKKRIKITSIDEINYCIFFKNAPESPHTLQTISDNLSTLINKADTIYPQYSNHNIILINCF